MDDEEISEVKRELSKSVEPRLKEYIESLEPKEFVQFITRGYESFLRKNGVQHPDVEKFFLEIWKYLQEEIKGGLQIFKTKNPGFNSFPVEWNSMEILGWKMGRDHFYEELIDLINLQFGVDLRQARGFETVKNLFSRKIESLEQHSKNIQDSNEQAKKQLEHGQRVLEEGQKLIESTQRFLDSRKAKEVQDETILQKQSQKENRDAPQLSTLLREFMTKENMSIEDVMTKIRRSRSTVNNLLSGKASPKANDQIMMCLMGFKEFAQNYTR